jgi:hypothetical protein
MISYKDGVITTTTIIKNGIEQVVTQSIEILAAQKIAEELMAEMYNIYLTITSILDGDHMKGSKHYDGNAFDQRIWFYLNREKKYIDQEKYAAELRKRLGKNYDVVVHKGSHIHIEYDPK